MIKEIISWIFYKSAEGVFSYIDKDNDGKISKEEIQDIIDFVETFVKNLRNARKKRV